MRKYRYLRFDKALAMSVLLLSCTVTLSAPVGHAPWVGATLAGIPCNGERENFGPFDYLKRQRFPDELRVVERYHFGPQVEQLVSGMRTGRASDVPADLDYTLRAWPNHHRALSSAIRYQVMYPNGQVGKRFPSADCYLQRALNFNPKDATSHMLYAIFLQRNSNENKALEEYRIAQRLDPSDVQIKYNLALLLVDLGEFEEARQYAQEVYATKFPLPGLKTKLVKAGQWEELAP